MKKNQIKRQIAFFLVCMLLIQNLNSTLIFANDEYRDENDVRQVLEHETGGDVLDAQESGDLELLDLYFDKESYTENDTFKLFIKVKSNSGIDFNSVSTSFVMTRCDLQYNDGNRLFIDNSGWNNVTTDAEESECIYSYCYENECSDIGGVYKFETFSIQDNEQHIYRGYGHSKVQDLRLVVNNSKKDIEQPFVSSIKIYENGEEVIEPTYTAGDEFDVIVKATDNVALGGISFHWSLDGEYLMQISPTDVIKLPDGSGWKGRVKVFAAHKPGHYTISYCYIWDESYNYTHFDSSGAPITESIAASFSVDDKGYESDKFDITSVEVEKESYKPGDLCKIVMNVTTTENIDSVSLTPVDENGNSLFFVTFTPKNENTLEGYFVIPASWQPMNVSFSWGTIFYKEESGLSPGHISYDQIIVNHPIKIETVYGGTDDISVLVGTEFDPMKSVSVNSVEGDIVSKIQVIGKVDTSRPGLYLLRYKTQSNLNSVYDNNELLTYNPVTEGIYYTSRWVGVTEVIPNVSGNGIKALVVTNDDVNIGGDTENIRITDEEGTDVSSTDKFTEEGWYSAEDIEDEGNMRNGILQQSENINGCSDLLYSPEEKNAYHNKSVDFCIDRSGPNIMVNVKGRSAYIDAEDVSGIAKLMIISGQRAYEEIIQNGIKLDNNCIYLADNPGYYSVLAEDYLGNITVKNIKISYTSHKVTIDYNDDCTKCVEITVADGDRIPEQEEPTSHGYKFMGWTNEGEIWDFSTAVTKDITLVASWVSDAELDNPIHILKIPNQKYTGKSIIPKTIVMNKEGLVLKPGKDYTAKYVNNVNSTVIDGTEKEPAKVIITGKGNYDETIEATFKILPASITDASINTIEYVAYKGKPFTPSIKVSLGKKALKSGRDYTYTINNIDSNDNGNITHISNDGTYIIAVKGVGNYSGSASKLIVVSSTKRLLTKAKVNINPSSYVYDGKEHYPSTEDVTVTLGGKIIPKEQYEISFEGDMSSVGNVKVVVRPKPDSDYFGLAVGTYRISGKSIKSTKLKLNTSTIEYTGYSHSDVIDSVVYTITTNAEAKALNLISGQTTLSKGSKYLLEEGRDYDVEYKDSISAGKKSINIIGRGFFTGKEVKSYKINSFDISKHEKIITINAVEQNKSGAKPAVEISVLVGGKYISLKEEVDYKVSYKKNTTVSTETKKATAIVKGIGNYCGSVVKEFTIIPKNLLSDDIDIRIQNPVYNNKIKEYKPVVVVYDSGKKLTLNKDYSLDYTDIITDAEYLSDNKTVGVVTIKPGTNGCYSLDDRAICLNYVVSPYLLSSKYFKIIDDQMYSGKEITLSESSIHTVGYEGQALKLGEDYKIVSYKNNINKGTASFEVEGCGKYSGYVTLKFKIKACSVRKCQDSSDK